MTIEEQWRALAAELGFEFKEGVRALLESPTMQRVLSEESAREGSEISTAALENPLVQAFLAKIFLGHATGMFRSFEFHLYRSGTSSATSGRNLYSTNVVLLFPKSLDIGLEIEPKNQGFFAKAAEKFFGGGWTGSSGSILTGNPEFDKLVRIRGRNEAQVSVLAINSELQRVWSALASGSWEPRVTDEAIRVKMRGKEIVETQAAKDVMERMADLAKTLG